MIYSNITLVIELLQYGYYGIVFLTLLVMQSLLNIFKNGLIRNLNLIGMLTLLELEAEV